MTYERQQKLKQETAHEMELVLDTFHNMLEPLEEYIGKAGHYSDWDSRRQIYRKTIADSNDTAEGFEDLFLTQLLIVKVSVNKKPEFFRKEVKKEYYRWINATGINVNNCPEKLKHFLYEINEILEGKGEKFVEQTKKLVEDVKLTPQDALGFFSALQGPLNRNDERRKLLKGKNWDEVENEKKVSGDAEQGEEAFNQISETVSDQNDFNFYQGDYYTNQSDYNRRIAIENIKQHIDEWEIKEVVTFASYYTNKKEKRTILIHKSAKEEYSWRYSGRELKFQPGKMYRKKDLRKEEWEEIESALNNYPQQGNQGEMEGIESFSSAQSRNYQPPTNSEIVQDVKNNPQNWRIDEIITEYSDLSEPKSEMVIIHCNARLNDYDQEGKLSLNGNPIYKWKDFKVQEKFEIKRAKNISVGYLTDDEISSVIREVKSNPSVWRFETIKGQICLIHGSAQLKNDEIGTLIHSKQKFSDSEWEEIKEGPSN